MLSKSKLKTWLKRKGFKPAFRSNTRNFLKYSLVKRSNCYFRFRTNEHEFESNVKSWTVDVSCPIEDFDRWANSCDEYAIPLEDFMKRY